MKISKEFMLREIAGEYIVVPTGQAVIRFMGLITVNEVGAFLWETLQNQACTEQQLTNLVCEMYQVEEKVARQDVEEFVKALKEREILE